MSDLDTVIIPGEKHIPFLIGVEAQLRDLERAGKISMRPGEKPGEWLVRSLVGPQEIVLTAQTRP